MVEKVIFEQGSEEKEDGSFMDIGGQSFQVEEQQVQRLRRKHAMNILGMPRRLAQLEWRDLVDEHLFNRLSFLVPSTIGQTLLGQLLGACSFVIGLSFAHLFSILSGLTLLASCFPKPF